MFVPNIGSLHKDALILSLKTHLPLKITPKTIGDISITDFIRHVYNMGVINNIEFNKTELTVELVYPKLFADSDIDDFDVEDILKTAEVSMRGFLITKSLLKEFPKVSD
jgi:hypothetical protein